MDTELILTQARFWNKVNVIPESNSSACWEWTGATISNGYGVASIGNGDTMLAHRYAASLNRDITNKTVMHICDNKICVRPDHLVVGTQSDNMRDMLLKGRNNRKLTIAQVRDIKSKELSRRDYALKYSITVGYIGEIQRGQSWGWA